jgi:enoyl-CoA hydratase/carnithine racemase
MVLQINMTSNIKIKIINSEISSIIIDEPKTYNSLSYKNLTDLLKALKKLDADKKIKVIVLEGAGKGFSAGHNLKEVRGLKKKRKVSKII